MMQERFTSAGRAVVLGAGGFIGSHLAHALVKQGYAVTLFDRHRSANWPEGAEVIVGDLTSPPARLIEAMEGASVFHLAGHTRPSLSTAGICDEIESEIRPAISLLELSRHVHCCWIFVSSGGTVYGEARTEFIAEDHPTTPLSSYGVVKLALEKYFHLYGTVHGTRFIIARLANPFGPLQIASRGQGLVASIFERTLRGEAIEIWGDGQAVRDYLFIDDAVDSLIVLASQGRIGATYNVGTGIGTSVSELVDVIGACLSTKIEVRLTPPRRSDVKRNVLDIGLIDRETGWRPAHSLVEGLVNTRGWMSGDFTIVSGGTGL